MSIIMSNIANKNGKESRKYTFNIYDKKFSFWLDTL